MRLDAGTRLGHYEVINPLGKGGMGEVYLAEDVRLGRRVALKVLPASSADDQEILARFIREARAASALNHLLEHPFERAIQVARLQVHAGRGPLGQGPA